MSEIKFVNRLGDAIERSAAAHIAARRSRIRRRLTLGALGFAIVASGVAAGATLISGSPEQLASAGIACYDRPSLDADTSILSTGDDTPIETCRRILKTDAKLVACAGESVAVFPGGRRTCEKLGLQPLPAEYRSARRRVTALARRVTAIESSADCIPPRELADRVQALLDGTPGWEGWRVWLRLDVEDGPCGSVSSLGGDGTRSVEGALAADDRRVMVFGTLPRSLEDLLHAADGLAGRLMDASGARCYDVAGLRELARRHLAPADRPVTFTVAEPQPEVEVMDRRGDRLAEGCAVIHGVGLSDDYRALLVGITS